MTRLGGTPMFQAWGETVSAQQWPLRSYLELGALPTAASCARLHAKNILHEWRVGTLADPVELLVSEITTNAVRASADHGLPRNQSPMTGVPIVRIWLASDRRHVLIQVWDGDDHCPQPQPARVASESGRGLLLVEKLSTQWGCYPSDVHGGKIVWALCTTGHPAAVT